ncbi:MAG: CpaF family protein [Micromonosporaceae bacterium]
MTGWSGSQQQALIDRVRGEVADRLRSNGARLMGPARAERIGQLVRESLDVHARDLLAAGRMPLDPPVEEQVSAAVVNALTGMGGLQPLLEDPTITNIFVHGQVVWVKRADGTKQRVPPVVRTNEELIDLIKEIAARAGADERRFDRGVPRVSVRLPDGSRLFATMLSREPSVSIRRHTLIDASLDEMAGRYGVMDAGLRDLFTAMVRAKKNVIICGGTDTGKTSLLRAFARAIPLEERLITIEDTDELALDQDPAHPDCVALQVREPNIEGEGGIDQAELVRWALRMAPDRVILGEARGGEVVPLLNCMSQGNDGSLATIHTSSSKQAFTRLQTYAAQAAERLPFEATAPLIAGAVDFVVHLAWSADGKRVVSSVREVSHADGRDVISNEVFAPGPDRHAVAAAPIRAETLDELIAAGLPPHAARGW